MSTITTKPIIHSYTDQQLQDKLLQSNAKFFEEFCLNTGSLTRIHKLADSIINQKGCTLQQLGILRSNLKRAAQGKQKYCSIHPDRFASIKSGLFGKPTYSIYNVESLINKINVKIGNGFSDFEKNERHFTLSNSVFETIQKVFFLTEEPSECYLLNNIKIPILQAGQKALFKREEGINGQKIPRTIFVDGENAYLLLNTKKDKAPKIAIDLRTGKKCLLKSFKIPKGKPGNGQREQIESEIAKAGTQHPKLLSYCENAPSKKAVQYNVETNTLNDDLVTTSYLIYEIFDPKEPFIPIPLPSLTFCSRNLSRDEYGLIKEHMIPKLGPGQKALFKKEEGIFGQKIPGTILVDGENAYLFLNSDDDRSPDGLKRALHINTGKVCILQSIDIPKEENEKQRIKKNIETAKSKEIPKVLSFYENDKEPVYLIYEAQDQSAPFITISDQVKNQLPSNLFDQVKNLKIPILAPGQKALFRREEGIFGQKIPRTILVDGENAYLFRNKTTHEDRLFASPGATHVPKIAVNLRTGKKCNLQSVKIPKGQKGNEKRKRIKNEIEKAQICNNNSHCPKLLSFYENVPSKHGRIWDSKTHCTKSSDDMEVSYLIYELRELGDLCDYMNDNRNIPLNDALQIGYDILLGLNNFHKDGYGHGDIKPENIVLYKKWGRIRADIIDNEGLAKLGTSQEMCTPKYLPRDLPYSKNLQASADRDLGSAMITIGLLMKNAIGMVSHGHPHTNAIAYKIQQCVNKLSKLPRSNQDYLREWQKLAGDLGVVLDA